MAQKTYALGTFRDEATAKEVVAALDGQTYYGFTCGYGITAGPSYPVTLTATVSDHDISDDALTMAIYLLGCALGQAKKDAQALAVKA